MRADARVETHALDDRTGVEAAGLGVGVELVEVAHAQGEVGVGKKLDGLGLGGVHEQHAHVLLLRALDQKLREAVRRLPETLVLHRRAHDDARGVEIVVQGPALPQEFRGKQDVPGAVLLPDLLGVADGDRGLDDHDRVRVDAQHGLDHVLHGGGVKIVEVRVIVGRGRDDHELCVPIGGLAVQRRGEPKPAPGEKRFDLAVPDGREAAVDHVHLGRGRAHGHDLVMLRQQHRQRQADIADARNCDFHGCSP